MIQKLRIMLVDDDKRMTNTLADILSLQGYDCTEVSSGKDAIEKASQVLFDCVLTDIKMPGMNGVELFQELRKFQPGLPVIFMTAFASDELIQEGLRNGAVGVLNKPLDIHQLLGFLASLGREHIVTVVDDDPVFCETLIEILERRGFRAAKVIDPHMEIEKIIEDTQIVVLDMKLNHIGGVEVLKEIRQHHPELPVLLVTGYRQEMAGAIQQAVDLNAYACLYKPLVIPELLDKLSEIQSTRLRDLLKGCQDKP